MSKGTVKVWNAAKGFGFIVEEGSLSEIFVHISGLIDEIKQGDTVIFETERGKKGIMAVKVRLA